MALPTARGRHGWVVSLLTGHSLVTLWERTPFVPRRPHQSALVELSNYSTLPWHDRRALLCTRRRGLLLNNTAIQYNG